MTGISKTTTPRLADLLADVDERHAKRQAQQTEIGREVNEAKAALKQFRHEREIELRAAVTEDRPARTARLDKLTAENRRTLDDATPRIRQVEAELAKLKREREALVDGHRDELADEYLAECRRMRSVIDTAADAMAAIDAQLAKVEEAGKRLFAGVKRAPDDLLAKQHVGNLRSDPTLAWRSATDLVDLATNPVYVGHQQSRWDPLALLRELGKHLAAARCLPSAYLTDEERTHVGRPGIYADSASERQVAVYPDALDAARKWTTPDALGFARLRWLRPLTQAELDRRRRELLMTGPGGSVGKYDPQTGGIVLPDDRERDKHGGVVLDPDAPAEPDVFVLGAEPRR